MPGAEDCNVTQGAVNDALQSNAVAADSLLDECQRVVNRHRHAERRDVEFHAARFEGEKARDNWNGVSSMYWAPEAARGSARGAATAADSNGW